jgi:hypothetical protein
MEWKEEEEEILAENILLLLWVFILDLMCVHVLTLEKLLNMKNISPTMT